MNEQHPLTNPIIQAITHNIHAYDDCRPLLTDMRAAADWQLEEVIEQLRENLHFIEKDGLPRYLKNTTYEECAVIDAWKLIDALKKAMRPQQQLEDN